MCNHRDDCYTEASLNYFISDGYEEICQTCADHEVDCGRAIWITGGPRKDHIVAGEGIEESHRTFDFRHDYQDYPAGFKNLSPDSKETKFGFELEIRAANAQAVLDLVNDIESAGLGYVTCDGSLHKYYGCEIVTHYGDYKTMVDVANKICALLDARYTVSSRNYGLHIHMTRPETLSLSKMLILLYDHGIRGLVERINRREPTSYCAMSYHQKDFINGEFDTDRYTILNTSTAYGTIEYRGFLSTTNAEDVHASMEWLLALQEYATGPASTLSLADVSNGHAIRLIEHIMADDRYFTLQKLLFKHPKQFTDWRATACA